MSATRSPVTSGKGVVSAGNAHAVSAGLDALERGGNAVDATVAAAFVSFVAEPNNAGIAGYGHLAAFTGGAFLTVDHGPRAPLPRPRTCSRRSAPSPRAYDWPEVADDANAVGHLAPAVPGAIAGLHAIHARAGRLPWASLLDAGDRARRGGPGGHLEPAAAHRGAPRRDPRPAALAASCCPRAACPARAPRTSRGTGCTSASWRTCCAASPSRSRRLLPRRGGRGDRRRDRRGRRPPDARDLETYAPKLLRRAAARFRDVELVTANDPVGNEALNILDCFPPRHRPGSAEHLHLLAEAMGHAFVDNVTYAGDPDHVPRRWRASPAPPSRGCGRRASRGTRPRRGRWPRPTRGRSRTATRARRRRRRPAGRAGRRRSSPPTPRATSSRSSRRSATTSGRRSRCPARASCSTTR